MADDHSRGRNGYGGYGGSGNYRNCGGSSGPNNGAVLSNSGWNSPGVCSDPGYAHNCHHDNDHPGSAGHCSGWIGGNGGDFYGRIETPKPGCSRPWKYQSPHPTAQFSPLNGFA